jgi:hypothetical protein
MSGFLGSRIKSDLMIGGGQGSNAPSWGTVSPHIPFSKFSLIQSTILGRFLIEKILKIMRRRISTALNAQQSRGLSAAETHPTPAYLTVMNSG